MVQTKNMDSKLVSSTARYSWVEKSAFRLKQLGVSCMGQVVQLATRGQHTYVYENDAAKTLLQTETPLVLAGDHSNIWMALASILQPEHSPVPPWQTTYQATAHKDAHRASDMVRFMGGKVISIAYLGEDDGGTEVNMSRRVAGVRSLVREVRARTYCMVTINERDARSGETVFSPAAVMLARLTGRPLVVCASAATRELVLSRTWDRAAIPLGPVTHAISEPLQLSRERGRIALDRGLEQMQAKLREMRQLALVHARG